MAYKSSGRKSTDLGMKGTAGRDCSPRSHQSRSLMKVTEPPEFVEYTDAGTPVGGKPPEARPRGAGGVIDPATYNVDNHALRVFSRYWEGKRAGPDWLHKRVEAADSARFATVADPLFAKSLPRRKKL